MDLMASLKTWQPAELILRRVCVSECVLVCDLEKLYLIVLLLWLELACSLCTVYGGTKSNSSFSVRLFTANSRSFPDF